MTPARNAARSSCARLGLVGRDDVVTRLVELTTSHTAPPLTLVTGVGGIGRSAVLAATRDALAASGVTTLEVRLAPGESQRPHSGVFRLGHELLEHHRARTAGAGGGPPARAASASAHGPLAEPRTVPTPEVLGRLARALAEAGEPLAILIDDAQWLDASSVAALAPLVGALRGASVHVVAAVRPSAGGEAGAAALAPLRADGLVQEAPLRPLSRAETGRMLALLLRAVPSASLGAAVRHACHGNPGLARSAVAEWRRAGHITVIDAHVCWTPPGADGKSVIFPRPEAGGADTTATRHLDPLTRQVAAAIAVLGPLAGAAPALAAQAMEVDERRVEAALTRLRAEGVLVGGGSGGWRFRTPYLAATHAAQLGPYATRRVSALAVTAIWNQAARCADPTYLLDRLVDTAGLVDPDRAAEELIAAADTGLVDRPAACARWLDAAIALVDDPGRQAHARFLRVVACERAHDLPTAVADARALLSEAADHLDSDSLMEAAAIQVLGLRGMGDFDGLTEIAESGWRSTPGGVANQFVVRAMALTALDRLDEAATALATAREHGLDADAAAGFAVLCAARRAATRGRWAECAAEFAPSRPLPAAQDERRRVRQAAAHVRLLLAAGELGAAEKTLAESGVSPDQLDGLDQAARASLSGRWDEAVEIGRAALARGAFDTGMAEAVAARELALILTARGRPGQARAVVERASGPPRRLMPLLVAPPAAGLARLLGEPQRARALLAQALRQAADQEVALGVEELLWRSIELDLDLGERARASASLAALTAAAERSGLGRGRLCLLLGRVAVQHDGVAAAEAVRLARERGQPWELAETLAAVFDHGLGTGESLLEAYELLGELGASLARARMRTVMRAARITVPHRQATVRENDHLLATLVAEELTNRELAALLETSEKSVEGWLTRLFRRTGYRSRVELAAAMLAGEYPG